MKVKIALFCIAWVVVAFPILMGVTDTFWWFATDHTLSGMNYGDGGRICIMFLDLFPCTLLFPLALMEFS